MSNNIIYSCIKSKINFFVEDELSMIIKSIFLFCMHVLNQVVFFTQGLIKKTQISNAHDGCKVSYLAHDHIVQILNCAPCLDF